MNNLFFRTNIAPYRIDTYNALHEKLNCELYFYWREETSQKLNMQTMLKKCVFMPRYLEGIKLGANSRKFCTNIWSILKNNNPNIVIVPEFQILTIQVLLYKWLFRKKFKVISMCDDSYDMLANDNDFSLVHRYARRLIAPMVDDILLVDSRAADWYQNRYGKGIWLPIIRNEKVEIPLYEQALSISNKFNKQYHLEGKRVLLYVGRLVEVKNLNRLISAIGRTKEDFVTVIVGDGPKLNELKQEASKINKEIIFAGHFENQEIRAWYNLSDVFILPSTKEPYGAVTNEALLAGCRVIVSDRCGSSCLVSEENGELINPLDIIGIATAIDRQIAMSVKYNMESTRKNLMTIKFEEIINNVVNNLKS